MTAPGGGGDRLEVPVVADASGFAKDAKAKVDAVTKTLRAKIRAEIDTARLQAQAQAAAKRVEKQTKVSLKVGVDARYLRESIKAALAGISSGEYRIKVGVDVDAGRVQRAMDAATGDRSTSIDVDADTSSARESVEAFRREQERRPVEVPIRPKMDRGAQQQSTRALKTIARLGLTLGKLTFGAAGASALAGGLVAATAAASQAVMTIGALPGLLTVAAQGIGVLVAGFKGIGGAVTALKAPKPAGGGAAASGAAAAKAQAQAQRQIADARQRVADVFTSSAQAIARAERGVAEAQKAGQRAQEALTRAREDAREKLEDYKLSVAGAALDEEAATLAVERARERWNETMRSPVSTELDRKEADLALRQAEQSLAEIKESNADLFTEADRAAKAGVEGSAEVVAAQADVADAQQGVADAEAELAQQRVDSARDVADAQRDLADAIADAAYAAEAAATGGGGVDKLAQAMDQLSPAGQRFARFVANTLQPRLSTMKKAIQEALLPGVQLGVERAMPFLDTLEEGLVGTGKVAGQFATDLGTMMGEATFRADMSKVFASNNRALGSFSGTGLNLVSILKDILVAAGPMIERFAEWTRVLTASWAESIRAKQESGALAETFRKAGDRMGQIVRIVRDLTAGLFNLGRQGTDTGDSLLDKLEALAAGFRAWSEGVDVQGKVREWFESMRPLFEQLVELGAKVAETIALVGAQGGGGLGAFVSTLLWLLDGFNSILSGPLGPLVVGLMQLAGVLGALGLAFLAVKGPISKIKAGFDGVKTAYTGIRTAFTAAGDMWAGLRGGAEAASNLDTKAARAGAKVRDLAAAARGVAASAWTGLKDGATAMVNLAKAAGKATVKVIAQTVALVANKVAQIASAVASGVLTAATWLLNVAMSMNPFVLIVLAVLALIAAFVWAYNKFDWFKDAVDAIFGVISDIITGVFGFIVGYFRNVWRLITDVFSGAFTVLRGIFEPFFNTLKVIVETVFGLIKNYIQAVWGVIQGIFNFFMGLITGDWERAWNGIKGIFSSIWEGIKGALSTVIGGIRGIIDGFVSGIRTVWEGLREIFAAPIRFVVNTVFNNGIRKVWNWVNDLWGGSDWPEYTFAKGGTVPGYAPGTDRVHALLSPGEGVLVPEAVRGLGGPDAVDALNAKYSSRIPGGNTPAHTDPDQLSPAAGMPDPRTGSRDTGGLWDDIKGVAGDAWDATGGRVVSGVANGVGSAIDAAQDLIAEGWRRAAEAAVSPVRAAINAFPGNSGFPKNIKDGGNRLVDRLLEMVGAKESEEESGSRRSGGGSFGDGSSGFTGAAGAGTLGRTWQSLRDVVQRAIPQARVNSSVRNTPDAHGRGKAVDFGFGSGPGGAGSAGLASIARYLYTNFGSNLYELIYTGIGGPPGGYQVKRGQRFTYDAETRRAHTNHVHAAVYDRGGAWPSGTAGVNLSGGTEGVLTPEGMAALGGWGPLDALNAGRPLASVVAGSAAAVTDVGPRGTSIGTVLEEGAVKMTVINPKPETAGETLNARMRRLASLGTFDSTPAGG